MQIVTMTELTRKTGKMIKALDEGKELTLLYRSKVIGTIKPERKPKVITEEKLRELEAAIRAAKPKKLIPRHKRDEVYRKNLEEKYGTRVS